MNAETGRKGLEIIDEVLSGRPHKDDDKLTDATGQLCLFRDGLIEALRRTEAPGDRERLSRANAVLSVIAAMHFPLGDVPWNELKAARGWLADLLADTAPA